MLRPLYLLRTIVLRLVIVTCFLSLSAVSALATTTFTATGTASVACDDSTTGGGGSSCPSDYASGYTLSSSYEGVTGFGLDTLNDGTAEFVTGNEHHISCSSSSDTCTFTVTITDSVTSDGSISADAALPISWDFIVGLAGTGTSETVVSYSVSLTLVTGDTTVYDAAGSTTTINQTIDSGSTYTISGTETGTNGATIPAGTYTATTVITLTYYQTSSGAPGPQIEVEVPENSVDFASEGTTTPEPATLGICGLGLAALGWRSSRRRRV